MTPRASGSKSPDDLNWREIVGTGSRDLGNHPGGLRTVAPLIMFNQFGESSLNFTVRFWSKLDDRLQIRSELNVPINEELRKTKLSFPFRNVTCT